jgi:hypothetical protein
MPVILQNRSDIRIHSNNYFSAVNLVNMFVKQRSGYESQIASTNLKLSFWDDHSRMLEPSLFVIKISFPNLKLSSPSWTQLVMSKYLLKAHPSFAM